MAAASAYNSSRMVDLEQGEIEEEEGELIEVSACGSLFESSSPDAHLIQLHNRR